MKLQSLESLVDEIDGDIAWRRREMTSMFSMVEAAEQDELTEKTLIRAATTLLYAHWEGFIKHSAESYLNFVAFQRLKNCELADSFFALVIKQRFHQLDASSSLAPYISLSQFVLQHSEDRSKVPYRKIIQTHSNLSSSVFAEILAMLDIRAEPYRLKAKLIDSQLLARRNHIAHGESLLLDREEYDLLHSEVLGLMNTFRNDVQNAAAEKSYKKAVSGEVDTGEAEVSS